MKKIILLCLLIFPSQSFTFEITNYSVYLGEWHQVTVAFDNIDKVEKVRCVIKLNGKPVGKGEKYIGGVGMIEIRLNPNLRGTTATCSILK